MEGCLAPEFCGIRVLSKYQLYPLCLSKRFQYSVSVSVVRAQPLQWPLISTPRGVDRTWPWSENQAIAILTTRDGALK